jgi:hypothetical protein
MRENIKYGHSKKLYIKDCSTAGKGRKFRNMRSGTRGADFLEGIGFVTEGAEL